MQVKSDPSRLFFPGLFGDDGNGSDADDAFDDLSHLQRTDGGLIQRNHPGLLRCTPHSNKSARASRTRKRRKLARIADIGSASAPPQTPGRDVLALYRIVRIWQFAGPGECPVDLAVYERFYAQVPVRVRGPGARKNSRTPARLTTLPVLTP